MDRTIGRTYPGCRCNSSGLLLPNMGNLELLECGMDSSERWSILDVCDDWTIIHSSWNF